jgi:hypothetical protein
MVSLPVRQLGQVGIVKDVNAFDLPPNGLSDGLNVRFYNGKISRAPVSRIVSETLTGSTPVFCYGVTPSSGFDYVLYANTDGRLFKVANGSEVEVTKAGATLAVDPRSYTACLAGTLVYVNRPHDVPYFLTPTAPTFALLPGWDSTWRCLSLRVFKGFLFAINVTKGINAFPNMVKWSDTIRGLVPPVSWDITDTTKLAGENQLAELSSPLVDGGPLGDNFILYSQDETWIVTMDGSSDIFDWRRLPFDNAGAINQNCWVEVAGKHYVFGFNDIYMHDGLTKTSLIDQRNRDAFFNELNVRKADKFFVAHDRSAREIMFCGVSGNARAGFPNPNGYCNFAAVYNYASGTWSFRDLPNVSSATLANVNTVWTYASVASTLTYANVGGSYYDQDNSFSRFPVFTSVADAANGLSVSKVHVLDYNDVGSVALARDEEAVRPAFAERVGIDLDEIGAELRGYKNARALMPQIKLFRGNVSLNVELGGHTNASSAVEWEPPQTFDPAADYKVDTREAGRYLAYRITMPTPNDFEVSGFDLDAIVTGKR